MCDFGISLLVAGLVMSAVSMGVSAYSSNKQTKAANQAAQYNAEMAKRNQEVANLQAVDAQQRGDLEEKQFRLNLSKQKGEMRAGAGASGAVVDTGSALDNLLDTVEYGELDALTIRHNTAMEVWGFKNQAANMYGQSELFRTSKQSVGLATGSTLLTGASNMLMSGASVYGGLKGGSTTTAPATGAKAGV
jgi:hypothetical protein